MKFYKRIFVLFVAILWTLISPVLELKAADTTVTVVQQMLRGRVDV